MKRLLLAFLFLSIGAQAMVPVSITDVKGTKFELNSAQKTALAQCGTLANMLKCSQGPIDFEGQNAPFITKANLEDLGAILHDPKQLKAIKDDQKCIDLFKLANYLAAPEAVLEIISAKSLSTDMHSG